MTTEQLGILNSLVTFAAENIPGGLNPDEREVAKIVGAAAIDGGPPKTHNYKCINVSRHKDAQEAANFWAEMGWRVVGFKGAQSPGYADELILERPVEFSHPDD